jgi:hypothetical protein
MDKLKKVGLSAICGSLAAVTGANAGDMSITGAASATWVSAGDGAQTGGNIGTDTDLYISASGEMDNGYTWSYGTQTGDLTDTGFTVSSSNMHLTMPGIGKLSISKDSSTPVMSMDDVMPSAYEEAWDGLTSSVQRVDGIGDGSVLVYSTEADVLPGATTMRLAYNTDWDHAAEIADGGSGNMGSNDHGSGWSVGLVSKPMDGLEVGASYANIDAASDKYEDDQIEGTVYAKYAIGQVTVGYQQSYEDPQHVDDQSVEYYDMNNYAISFQVNDDLSVSYGEYNSKQVMNGVSTTDVEAEASAWNIAYNIGGATIKAKKNKVDNSGHVAGTDLDLTEVAISFAF